ncbi:MAG: Fe3+/spermidine/putrescine ABC transporter ATP-binding protein, partial [Verrucomicrobiae bacterium]|nr:Fe3+/spermidine/putrescine ABC transporter ATP-binding protein [Verrucomicrobiae bacterium]
MGEAEALYERPRNRFVGQFLGSVNLIDATVKRREGDDLWVETEVGTLRVSATGQTSPAAQQSKFTLAIRPEK